VSLEQRLGDREAHDGVAEELEAFVVAGAFAGVLMEPRRVRQGLGEQLSIPDRKAEALGEDVGAIHDPELARGAGLELA